MSNTAFLSLGTNIGDRQENLKLAIQQLADTPYIEVEVMSSIYETESCWLYGSEQQFFETWLLSFRPSLTAQIP